MRIDLVGATYTIRDRLTDKLEKAVSAGAATPGALVKAQTARSSALSTRTKTQMNGEPWEHLNHTRQAVLDFVTPPPDEYTFFPANQQARARAILHFAKLLSESKTRTWSIRGSMLPVPRHCYRVSRATSI